MLSRVAERLYWAARYLERAENTARLVSVYDNLLYDLPSGMIEISWFNLIDLNSSAAEFNKRYKVPSERNIVKFILLDESNLGSLSSSVRFVRENFRTTRDVIPPSAWEQINELNIFVSKHASNALARARRHDFVSDVIEQCQAINGLLTGTLMRDDAWDFLKLGRNIERADMTTRILDAGAAVLEHSEAFATSNPAQVIWGNVLRSQGAYMSYRRAVKSIVRGSDVAGFLLNEANLPRSVAYCRDQINEAAIKLAQDSGKKQPQKMKLPTFTIEEEDDLGADFRNYLNDLQLTIGELHNRICETWFARD